MLHKFVVCEFSSLEKAVHVFPNLAKYHAVMYNTIQFVLSYYILRYHCDRYDHVLIPLHWCIKLGVFEIDSHIFEFFD